MDNKALIAWLAGVFDGEGCVRITWKRRNDVPIVALSFVNTSQMLLIRSADIIFSLGVDAHLYAMSKGKLSRRQCYQLVVANKRGVLRLAEALEPYLVGKRDEIRVAIWYLRRSVQARQYKISDREREALREIGLLKRGQKLSGRTKKLIASDTSTGRKRDVELTIGGETKLLTEWAQLSGTPASRIYVRLRRGWSHEDAVFKSAADRGQPN